MKSEPEHVGHSSPGWLETLERELDRRERIRERALDTEITRLRAQREADWQLLEERDRRYAEVDAEREKMVTQRRESDRLALDLAREIQNYKDEKANDLRSQIESERGNYMTRTEYDDKHDLLISRVDQIRDDLAELRTAVAIGPRDLIGIRSRLDRGEGAHLGTSELLTRVITVIAVLVSVASVVVLALH